MDSDNEDEMDVSEENSDESDAESGDGSDSDDGDDTDNEVPAMKRRKLVIIIITFIGCSFQFCLFKMSSCFA